MRLAGRHFQAGDVIGWLGAGGQMIDDFQVPDDDGYGYDDYGMGKVLTREYIAPAVSQFQLVEFYPTTPSVAESGLRRGCIVVARDPSLVEALSRISLLRRWELH